MDSKPLPWHSLGLASLLLTVYLVLLNLWRKRSRAGHLLPPGPPGWPIVGNLLQLGRKPNESLWALSRKYGPLMTLSLGMRTAVVVSSPAMAKDFLKTHDHVFAGRTVIAAAKALSIHRSSMTWAEYGPRWRKLRRIANTELFSQSSLQALQHLRRDQVSRTLRLIFDDRGKMLSIGHAVFFSSLNLLGNMIFSTPVFDPHDPDSADFKDTMWKLMKLGATPNLVDCFPFFEFLDPQGVRRQTGKCLQRLYNFFDVFIKDRLDAEYPEPTGAQKDFLDVLLGLRNEDFSLVDVKGLIAELFIAGSESTTTTIEWGMAELLRNPHTMRRVQQELEEVIGRSRKVEESDIENLPYLGAVVKEVFRLHTPSPLLLPHKAESSYKVAGYLIPKDTQVVVNVWGMGRDPEIWKDPLSFLPGRFMEGGKGQMDFRGQDFELIPFGAGRRICPGLPLGSRIVHLVLASLVHSFEWAAPDGRSWEEMDMSDLFGLSLKKAVDLKAIPTPRLPHHIY